MNDKDKSTVYNIHGKEVFLLTFTKGLKSAGKKDALKHLAKAIKLIQTPLLS